MEDRLRINAALWLLVLCLLAFWAAYVSPVSYSGDSRLTLLTTQALLENGSARLDGYFPPDQQFGNFSHIGGHIYDYFPLGTSLYSLPAVWLARLRGMDMARSEDNLRLENLLSALLVAVTPLLIFLISREFVDYRFSFLITLAFVFGSTMISSMAVMLWSIDLSMVLVLASLLLLVQDARQAGQGSGSSGLYHRRSWLAFGLGWLLFSAYLVRPSTSVFIMVTLAYLLICRRPLLLRTLLVLAAGLGIFMIYSWLELGQLLPDYYSPGRLRNASFITALVANLVSPGRGLLVYNPFLMVTLAGSAIWFRQLYRRPFFVFGLTWFGLQYLSIAGFRHWWGGWSYGPRLLVDALPAALLLTLEVFRIMQASAALWLRRLATVAFMLLTVAAIFINTLQGLFNPNTLAWNASPNIDFHTEYLWDWQHPLFLASPQMLQQRMREYRLPGLPEYTPGQTVLPNSSQVIFENWSEPARNESGALYRWSSDRLARLVLKASAPADAALSEPGRRATLALNIEGQCLYAMQVLVRLNGQSLGKLSCPAQLFEKTLHFPAAAWRSQTANILEFDIPEAAVQMNLPAGWTNPMNYALQLHSLQIAPLEP